MANLPVREMVLYKHGVGFFVRQGEVEGQQVQLTFRKDEINDVLKSLAVFDQAGGQVLGIHYQTPMDRSARLASTSIRLSQGGSLRDLVRDLRGRVCDMTFAGTAEIVHGRIIGLDEARRDEEDATVSILTSIEIRVFPLKNMKSLRIVDEQSSHDLTYFLDTSMAEDDRRVVTVRLSEGKHDLAVYYVAPSPTWRVSYRLVAERDEDASTGKALLQGWGLFDNRLEEDLDDVRVTLVAGQPISFIYELYASRIPQRPTVQDESRIAPGPIEYAGAMDMMFDEEESVGAVYGDVALSEREENAFQPTGYTSSAPKMERRAMAKSAKPQAETKDTGETFQYIVTAPVSVKRGESALVPIIGKEISYDRELLYNRAKLPDHPVAALRYKNTTGLTLERGPVTVVEDGDYKGEAVIPFTKEDSEVYVPFAVELGVKITECSERENKYIGLHIENQAIFEQYYTIASTTYIIENTTSKAQTVTIEAPIQTEWELYETRKPDVETANEERWKVDIAAKMRVEFVRKERILQYSIRNIRVLDYRRLSEYLENKWLDDELYTSLKEILDTIAAQKQAQQNIKKLKNEQQAIYNQQEQIRANLGALGASGQEAALRKRLLNQLESTQDRLDAIDKDLAEAETFIQQAEKKVRTLIDALATE
ncbi:MAG: hypothetical protein Q9P01_19575 [Anaerolineae bacterium]|nr:hypothetical protein [Anaerolineae bacterium]MDQ7036950.1 hypothetical protein [Anaerolineae bacterium]